MVLGKVGLNKHRGADGSAPAFRSGAGGAPDVFVAELHGLPQQVRRADRLLVAGIDATTAGGGRAEGEGGRGQMVHEPPTSPLRHRGPVEQEHTQASGVQVGAFGAKRPAGLSTRPRFPIPYSRKRLQLGWWAGVGYGDDENTYENYGGEMRDCDHAAECGELRTT